jgi:hypothetical protein
VCGDYIAPWMKEARPERVALSADQKLVPFSNKAALTLDRWHGKEQTPGYQFKMVSPSIAVRDRH